ncbi:hypothetical protein BDC45DRAFT_573466 [Circinella umbellata]|nr:hypothetical protein BDC45DRAFT_573466 [Circinella umbellata]
MPPKYRGFGTNEKHTFRSLSRTGIRESTHVQRVTPTVDQNGSHQISSSINRIRSSEWEDVDDSTRKRKRNKVEDRIRNWANILPMLTDAFKQGCGVETPLLEALTPMEDPLLCSCPGKSSKFTTCVFKCGMCKSSELFLVTIKKRFCFANVGIRASKIEYCKNCQEHSLPVVLIRRHLFPLTPTDPNVAIHVEQIRTMHLMHYICRTSIHAIAEWARVEYHYQLPIPASFKQRLSEALPMYDLRKSKNIPASTFLKLNPQTAYTPSKQQPISNPRPSNGNTDSSNSTPSAKRTRSTSAKTDSRELTEEMKEEYKIRFEALKNEKKWDLGNGVFVEDLMYEYGSNCDFEHLAHSFILDIHDPCWKNVFTCAQLKVIASHGNPALMDYDLSCKELFSSLSKVMKLFKMSSTTNTSSAHATPSSSSIGATFVPITSEQEESIIDGLWKTITEYGFIDPKTRYNEHWIQKTMIEIIDLYRYKVIEWVKNGSEMDFVIRIRMVNSG